MQKRSKGNKRVKKHGIYCFEIQGVLYWYTFNEQGIGRQYKEPENFRAEDRTTNELRRAGRKDKVIIDGLGMNSADAIDYVYDMKTMSDEEFAKKYLK